MSKRSAKLRSKCRPIQYQVIERKRPQLITLHGDKISDYYDWLKNESERKNWILKNENYTLGKYLELNSQKHDWTEIRKIFHNPIDYELFSDVQLLNGHIFYTNRDFSNQLTYKSIFKRVKSLKDERPHVVFDSNKIQHGSVIEHEYSPNGKYCAFTISDKSQNAMEVIVIDVASGDSCGKSLELFDFERIAWSANSEGFFIYYDPNGRKKRNLYYHYLDEEKPDRLIAKIRKSEAQELSFHVSYDYKYLILRGSRMLCIANIETFEEDVKFKMIFEIVPDATYDYVGNDGDFFLFLTNVGAPNHHLIEIDIKNKKPRNNFDIVVAENLDGRGVLKSTFKHSGYLFLNYIEKAQSSVYLYSITNQRIEYKIDFKDEQVVSSKIDKFGVFFETRSFKTPRKVYRIEFNQLVYRQLHEMDYSMIEPVLWKESKIPNLDELEITVKYDTYLSFDGTEVPMTIIQKKQNDGYRKPCLVYAYGGFGECLLPRFDLFFLLFVELFNGVVVFIHIRGGGELGDRWLLKPTEAERSFCDLIFGVEYLKGESYADLIDSNKIAFYGTSHGALTGAVAMNIKQDLFNAAILLNGNMDLVNDLPQKGRAWAKQYGSLTNKDDFDCIKHYAPLLHIQQATKTTSYPPTLLVASKKDEIVPITNSLKYLAHRREAAKGTQYQIEKPVLMKIIHSGGHNYRTAAKTEYIDTVFVKLKFFAEAMELKVDKKYETNQSCRSFVEIMSNWFTEPPVKYQLIEQRAPKVTALHREKILDYYDWLKEKCHWNEILKEEAVTLQNYLESNSTKNDWPEIREMFHNSVDYEMYRDVQCVNGYIFYSYVDFSRSINKPIYRRVKTLEDVTYGRPREILNSNRVMGTFVEHAYSPDGEWCAFTISSETQINVHKLMVLDIRTGRTYGKCLQLFTCKKIAWSGDSLGFFIYYDPEGKKKRHLYYHYLEKEKPDKLIAKIRKVDANTVSFMVSSDYKHLILSDSRKMSIANISSLDRDVKFDLIFKFSPDITYEYIGNYCEFFYFLTNFGAPKHHVIEVNVRNKVNMWNVDVVIPENLGGHGVLVAAQKYANYMYLIYMENVQNSMYLYSLTSRRIEFKIDLEDESYVSMNIDPSGFFLETQSFKTPHKIYRVNFDQLVLQRASIAPCSIVQPMVWKESKISNLNVSKFRVHHDSFQSFDGIKIPMTFIQKSSPGDAYKRPCLVFAYGGYGIPMTPLYKLFFLLFVELFNGVVVFVHIRGGGELGDGWVLKPTEAEISFKDLVAGVEYLKEKAFSYAIDSFRIAFYGASHGGLVGAVVMNMKRDLFAAAILQNGNMDLINDLPHKGRIWAKQYGNLSKKEDFDCIKRYAPLLHVQRANKADESYPITLIVASRFDEVVSIANSIKYLAHRREKAENDELQRDKPTLMKVLNSGGHHYETAKKLEILDAIFVKLQFLAEAMEMKCDKTYRKKYLQQKSQP